MTGNDMAIVAYLRYMMMNFSNANKCLQCFEPPIKGEDRGQCRPMPSTNLARVLPNLTPDAPSCLDFWIFLSACMRSITETPVLLTYLPPIT